MSRDSMEKSRHYLRDDSNSQKYSFVALLSDSDFEFETSASIYNENFNCDYDEGSYSVHIMQHHRGLSMWRCLISCRHRFEQQIARRRVEQGLRLYNKNKQKAAILKWHSALKQITKRNDRFVLLGYLYHAFVGFGKYRQSLGFAHSQLIIAEEMDSANLRAEAYLNLAKIHKRMGNLEKALSYARHSLYNECDHCRTAALVQITLGSLHLELAYFCKALRAFQQAYTIAQRVQDPTLELQIYVRLSELFGRLQDTDKSAMYASKAYNLCRTLHANELNSRHHRAALLQMASALRKQGELGDAHDYCSEATRLALISGDQPCYAKSIRIMGDIYRKKMEIGNAYRQYESAMNSAFSMGDRLCQIEAMDGAAKCLEILRDQRKICNCRPLEFNNKLLETATRIGAKLLIRAIRVRLLNICQSLGDDEQLAEHEREIQNLERELELICGACDNAFGYEMDSLQVLSCAHIFHARCLYDLLSRRDRKKIRSCPDCDKTISSTLYLQDLGYDSALPLKDDFESNGHAKPTLKILTP